MPDMQSLSLDRPAPYVPSLLRGASARSTAPRRDKFAGFVRDEDSAALLRDVLGSHGPIHTCSFAEAIAQLARMKTPEILLIDLSGEDQPLNAMMQLADVVEAGTEVLLTGAIKTVNFYRTVTKGMGVKEYLPKPLHKDEVARNFLPFFAGLEQDDTARGGRMLAVLGARGGVGVTTIATNLAWFAASAMHRHTVLLDGDLNAGTVAMHLDLPAGGGLSAALEMPERLDQLLIERSVQAAGERLHILAGLEPLEREITYEPASAAQLIAAIRQRYNFLVADAGARLEPFARDLLGHASRCMVVLDPTLVSARNFERLTGLLGAGGSGGVIAVLNKAGMPGGLAPAEMERSIGRRFNAVIPYLPRLVPRATESGDQAAAVRGAFRTNIAALAEELV